MSDPWNDYSSEVDADMGNEVAAPEQDKKVTPVKLGRGATAGLVVTFVIIFVILALTFSRCSLEKKISANSNNSEKPKTTESAEVIVSQSASNGTVDTTKIPENPVVTDAPGSSSPVEVDPKNNENSDGGLTLIAEPSLSKLYEARGIVSSKKVYKVGNSYVYCLNVAMLNGDGTINIQYFCSRKPYDQVFVGQSFTVQYQIDSENNISIYSLTN